MTFYELLGVPETRTLPETKQAYKQLARKYHPAVSLPELVAKSKDRLRPNMRLYVHPSFNWSTCLHGYRDGLQETQPRRRLEFEQDGDLPLSYREDEMVQQIHSKLSEEIIPRVGMEFKSEDEAYEFYNAYALVAGFSVRRSTTHKHKGAVLDRIFVCSCQGKRRRDKRDDVYRPHRAETRFGCLAMLRISCRQTGKYRIVNFIADHNHALASPSKSHLFISHRRMSTSQASEVDLAEISGIAPKQAFEFMARQAGGYENLGFSHVDYKNYLRSKRSLQIKSGDTGGVLEYLQRMKVQDPNFFYTIQVDEDDLITNIFWADAKMMDDYEDFGDVVCFDTTYRKHKDGRPIALFVGVNHHKQTTVFGAALLYDEKSETFVWLFDTFSRAMGGKLPKTMLTDQDIAMSTALHLQWPETRHRLCVWHIFQNAAIHLSAVFSRYNPEFSRDFSNCIYNYEYEEEFLDAWSKMLEKYQLQDNNWLKRMFSIKEKWALVYGRDTFCADMVTTQRSESMNKLIKGYISYKHDLRKFFENFQRLFDDRRYGEMSADFKASQSKAALWFPIAILKHAASVYTPEVFVLFQEQVCIAYDYHLEVCCDAEKPLKYVVTPPGKHCSFIVSFYDDREGTVCCTCRKFEFAGLLCSHILKVFSHREIPKIPSKYILKRWTKDAKRGSTKATCENSNVDQEDPKTATRMRYRDLCRRSTRLFARAAEIEDGYTLVKETILNLMREIDARNNEKPLQSSLQNHLGRNEENHDMDVSANGKIQTVRGVKPKPKSGTQSSKRPISALEKATNKSKRHKQNRDLCHSDLVALEQGSHSTMGSTCFIQPWDPSMDTYSTSLDYTQGNMYISSLVGQPSHTALLTSIGVPQVQPR